MATLDLTTPLDGEIDAAGDDACVGSAAVGKGSGAGEEVSDLWVFSLCMAPLALGYPEDDDDAEDMLLRPVTRDNGLLAA